MTIRNPGLIAAVLLSFTVSLTAFGHDAADHSAPADRSMAALHGQLVRVKDAPADWVAKAQADYPLDSCIVSEDKLKGDMGGPPVDFVYRQEGKPDRLVRFCCKDCAKDFKKDPTKYLNTIDAAAAKNKTASTHS